ncbi:hypothetical protein CAI21_22520 [Alkalilimnicola ehrlichii]|uniref:Uncharacterized protein n=1 Tax=Alkalilimnicola ehrlichii TaxID=351052 RepID=A0A3E0WEV4_9GAMM|nr:hypothetical protein [Alkalilimnicola ehrlichii]RFA24188.1 hypothetical protein CAI21_22520 [Alkalilimnicola ehrlichii]RFA30849.1 hypothetical protein CAL65_22670 [Alkalilimnicola ehrlichii]
MKLIGSRQEQQLRGELLRSNRALKSGLGNPGLLRVLKESSHDPEKSYVLNWIPEQGEDIYTVLVFPGNLMEIEIPRGSGSVEMRELDLRNYAEKCSRINKLKLSVALQLMERKKAD